MSRWQLGVAETERDPLSSWFGEPTAYEVTAPGRGALTLHPSRVIRFLGSPLPDPTLGGAGWSDSVLFALYDAIHAVALTTTGATSLMHEAKVDVVTVPNLSEHLSNAATTAQLSSRFAYAATMKSINNLLLLGDGETWARERIDFSGLPEMVRTFLQVAAGAADIPVTRLLGQSPAGLSATGDSDTRNYYDMIAARQEIDLRPQLERLDRFLLASAGVAPGALRFDFRPLWQMDAAAKAAVALQKAQATGIYAGLKLWPAEVMAGLVAGQLAEDGTYPNAGAVLGDAAPHVARPVQDYSPDQPRDPQGRWTNGGAVSAEQSEAANEGIRAQQKFASIMANGPVGEFGNASTSPHAPDGTPIELAGSSRKGLAHAIAAFIGGAVRLVQKFKQSSKIDRPNASEPTDRPTSGPSGHESSASSSRNLFPENDAQLKHIFRNDEGHLVDSASNRKLLEDVSNEENFLGYDSFGNTWWSKLMDNGSQIWVQARNGKIINGGVNQTPNDFNPQTGLSSPARPSR